MQASLVTSASAAAVVTSASAKLSLRRGIVRRMNDPAGSETPKETLALGHVPREVRRFRLVVVEGPGTGTSWESSGDSCSIGSQSGNDLCVPDPTVSRYHCELRLSNQRVAVEDLGSKNGTFVDGVQVKQAFLRASSVLRLGSTTIRFELGEEVNRLPVSQRASFGRLIGQSAAMRSVFGVLERAAPTESTLLLEGETGTGKTEAAESIHRASPRAGRPFVVVDCAAIPDNLLESELFGHERGAFTGAVARRQGAFEEADGGTLFLDEIGELPALLQPKLLRVLETRAIRRVGGTGTQKVDVRIIAATNRDLRAEVNAGRFRADLYFRLAVVRVALPPLRARTEDLPLIAEAMLRRLGADATDLKLLARPDFHQRLLGSAWPGNVRELRNYLERCLVFDDVVPPEDVVAEEPGGRGAGAVGGAGGAGGGGGGGGATRGDDDDEALLAQPLPAARERAVEALEKRYLEALLRRHDGRMNAAAAAAGIGRVYLYKLLVKHQLKKKGE
jgi:DNA-binding NtrC family response regulator